MFDQGVGLDLVVRPALGQRRQCGLGHLGRLETFGLQVKELLLDGLLFALSRFGDGRLGALKGRLRMHHQPALGHAVVT
jgi:hypothetical protein